MTGVGDVPRSLPEFISWTVREITALKRRRVSPGMTSVDWDDITDKPATFPPPQATQTVIGGAEIATAAEVQTGTDDTRIVTPAGLSSRTATETRTGLAEIATAAEVQTGTDNTRIVSPAGLTARLNAWAVPNSNLPQRLRSNSNVGTLDCNTTTDTGWYAGFVWTNAPANTIATLEVINYSPDWIAQTFTVLGDTVGRIYHRIRHSGTTWSAWVEQPRATIPTLAPSDPLSSYPMGSSVFLASPAAGWPDPSVAGAVHTIRAWSDGGAIQYWTGYNAYEGRIWFRQWLLGGGGVWTSWKRIAVAGQDGVPYAQATGTAPAANVTAGGLTNTAITFPAGIFTQAPVVMVTQVGTDFRDIVCGANLVTASGFNLWRGSSYNPGVARNGVGAQWHAIQMTP